MKNNKYSIISFILIPVAYSIPYIILTLINYITPRLDFLGIILEYKVKMIAIDTLGYTSLILPPILLLLSTWFGIKHTKSNNINKGYRILSIISVTLSVCSLAIFALGYFII